MAHSSDLEATLRAALASGDIDGAARALMRGYGPEILGWLHGVLPGAADADEVFAAFAEAMWRALPRFEGKSSFRTWSYAIARNGLMTWHRRASRDRLSPAASGPWSQVAGEVRSTTAPWLQTDVKDAFRRLRDALPLDDRTLLVLRVDRALDWGDIALIWSEGEVADEAALRRRAATLRKRFERVKDQLRARAKEAGLL